MLTDFQLRVPLEEAGRRCFTRPGSWSARKRSRPFREGWTGFVWTWRTRRAAPWERSWQRTGRLYRSPRWPPDQPPRGPCWPRRYTGATLPLGRFRGTSFAAPGPLTEASKCSSPPLGIGWRNVRVARAHPRLGEKVGRSIAPANVVGCLLMRLVVAGGLVNLVKEKPAGLRLVPEDIKPQAARLFPGVGGIVEGELEELLDLVFFHPQLDGHDVHEA